MATKARCIILKFICHLFKDSQSYILYNRWMISTYGIRMNMKGSDCVTIT